ncbi:ribose 5-phosphate isomerase B [Thermodesulfovibrio yellowstonii]|uniref:Ribose 5-phosphate isomerase B n=1 Tax=Thermodesulfovibrio yellowstonii TaxID=28262 RepID=A0A9W6LK05_9BACT|nr:ribose 5-phosphate isomerase B [Thermodesulfovibrio islandicus]GLI53222.1 ribose 5-phosphate isomerase B [Thermodesulfovibrio islandicus]
MKIAIGADHAGFELKELISQIVEEAGHEIIDMGTGSSCSVDYPDYAEAVAQAVSNGKAERGILICGTGIGMSIVANKFKNVRAALCNDLFTAKMSRLHNDANILCMGARVIGKGLAIEIVKTWLSTPFEAERHLKRVEKINIIERKVINK